MFTIAAVESIRFTRTVDRSWAERLLAASAPHRTAALAAMNNAELGAELAAAASRWPGIIAAFENLLAQGAEFSRCSDFTVATVDGPPAEQFAVYGDPGRGHGQSGVSEGAES